MVKRKNPIEVKENKYNIMKTTELRNLIRETIKEMSEDAAMKKSALGMAMYGKKSKMNEQDGQVNIFGYQTQHFDICPGAQSLYKAIVDGEHGKQDKDLVIRVAKAHDTLFYLEKLAKAGSIEVTQELVDTAQNQADLIVRDVRAIASVIPPEIKEVGKNVYAIATGNPKLMEKNK